MSQTVRSLFIIATIGAAGVILIAATFPAAIGPTLIVVGFAVGIVCIAAACIEGFLLYNRLAGTFTRLREHLQSTGDMT